MSDLAPHCASCRRRHSPALPCWTGRRVRAHLQLVLSTWGDVCCHCHEAGCDSVEHVRPRSRWGDDSIANTRPAHLSCNASRGTGPMLGWDERPATHSPRVTGLLLDQHATTSRSW